MTDIQKAIKHFKCERDGAIAILDSGFGTKPNESDIVYKNRKLYAELAISALEKQVLKKPIIEKDKVMFGIICGNCPVCDSGVYSTTNLFCNHCGQALDWSDE